MVADHTFRYAFVDLLYWYEFQNKCADILESQIAYLTQIESNAQINPLEFLDLVKNYETLVSALFDILNCDKITNVQYFAISEEIFGVFSLLFKQKVLGLEKVFTKVFELFDSLLVLCFS